MPCKAKFYEHLRMDVLLKVANVSNINTVDQTFSCTVMVWTRTLNAKDIKTGDGDKLTLKNFDPRLRFPNLLETSEWKMTSKELENGEMMFKHTVTGTFAEQFELQSFPFDRQELSITMSSAIPTILNGKPLLTLEEREGQGQHSVVSWAYFTESNIFQPEEKISILFPNKGPMLPENSTVPANQRGRTDPASSTDGTQYPLMQFTTAVRRYPSYFIYNCIIPVFIITALTLSAYALEHDNYADRLGLDLTLVLTSVAFKLQIAEDLPNLSYLTLIDKIVLASFMFVCLATCVHCVTVTEEGDLIGLYTLAGILGVLVLVSFSACYRSWRRSMVNRRKTVSSTPATVFPRDAAFLGKGVLD